MYNRIIVLWCLIIFLPLGIVEGHPLNKRERSFYALSSLRFYLDEITYSEKEETDCEKIHFDEGEIDRLWATAAFDPLFAQDVLKAKVDYDKALRNLNNPILFNEFSEKSKITLNKIWTKLNRLLLEANEEEHSLAKSAKKGSHRYPNFDDNASLTGTMKSQIKPYLLPLKNPIKKSLDPLFKHPEVLETDHSLSQAGFITLFSQANSFIRVAKHPSVPGYLFKIYPHTEMRQKQGKPGWEWLVMRCKGAENVRNLIKRKKLRHFTVPDKWLYPLPTPSPTHPNKQPIVLVVTDMKLVSKEETVKAWKNKITRRHLDELFCIISHGYSSTYLVHNIPYTGKGKFSCIDTEHPKRNLSYKKVKYFLSEEMNQYWDKLVRRGGAI